MGTDISSGIMYGVEVKEFLSEVTAEDIPVVRYDEKTGKPYTKITQGFFQTVLKDFLTFKAGEKIEENDYDDIMSNLADVFYNNKGIKKSFQKLGFEGEFYWSEEFFGFSMISLDPDEDACIPLPNFGDIKEVEELWKSKFPNTPAKILLFCSVSY